MEPLRTVQWDASTGDKCIIESTSVPKPAQLRREETLTIRSREPMVIVPLSVWRRAEELLEDQEALASAGYRRRIQKARREAAAGKLVHPFR
jgi:hypothetical protein